MNSNPTIMIALEADTLSSESVKPMMQANVSIFKLKDGHKNAAEHQASDQVANSLAHEIDTPVGVLLDLQQIKDPETKMQNLVQAAQQLGLHQEGRSLAIVAGLPVTAPGTTQVFHLVRKEVTSQTSMVSDDYARYSLE
jgi:pyruvate kinase